MACCSRTVSSPHVCCLCLDPEALVEAQFVPLDFSRKVVIFGAREVVMSVVFWGRRKNFALRTRSGEESYAWAPT